MKKISKIFIGTNNIGKLREISNLIPKHIEIFSPKDFNNISSPKESGKTFIENSIIKAKFFSIKTNLICLADDSGLEIDILNGDPGIYSARWSGPKSNFDEAIDKVFFKLNEKDKKWKLKKISARFVCALSIFWPEGKNVSVTGTVEGFINKKKQGKNGFGYDPIFRPLGSKRTFAEMELKKKYTMDHRFVAFQKIKKFF